MVVQEFIVSAAGVVNASMILKVVTQNHPRLAMIRDVRVVDRQKAPPVAQNHHAAATLHPDDAIAHVIVVKIFSSFNFLAITFSQITFFSIFTNTVTTKNC